MGTENLKYYAVFEADTYIVTWVIDGAETVETLVVGAAITAPEAKKENYTFKHWSLTADGEAVTPETAMGTENLKYYAVFEADTYTVTWVIDGAEKVETFVVGAAITAPEAAKDGFNFLGWSLTENGELVTPETVMGTENLKYYAVFEEIVAAVKIKLVPIEGSTGVVERNGVIESYNDGYTVTDAEYETPADYDEYYVYGLTGRRINANSINTHFTVNDTENGYFVLENSELSGKFGTGAKIKVYDKNGTEDTADDILVEEFYVVIFGDINGDASINASDSTALKLEVQTPKWSGRRNAVPYRVKSADINLSKTVNASDRTALDAHIKGVMTIDQTTGLAS